ncbi:MULTISPECIES: NRAMP family divalent metal transporter [unclassified Janthinobacterium]|uniref:NRAMP family divalent metal transporter n=1 Tax=unclassified Janthinobacterium TaxID=2610881 RepID=UPI0016170AC0|nr:MULTISPECIES: NRAMP family divalent metal transporter [unclassified Janthinobacterium]MBB5371480.1 Mn2+/Fe2+ NRAMP family transporter [Janthinobacterium sp. K2C7]MBB5384286.1 Mn2+/Fe2+ NRAMP family transporter [Janthinobacterium sp. K2Li3]MBB5389561.1 Mn2+/Fe2+ NRAMP family transporter [Janthinobacterium sp. K2E3]
MSHTLLKQVPPSPASAHSYAGAVLDEAHVGDIHGAFGSIGAHDHAPRRTWWAKFKTLLAILGPGLIVMVGDNDAGAFGTYTQAGQNYGTTLLWTLLMLIPVLYINQEMVLRLGAVTGVGHARLIFERFGKFWGAFSVIDLFVLNALTIVTEFIGISLGLDYLGVSKLWGLVAAAIIIMGVATTGNFRRFERFAMLLVFGSLLLVPVVLMIHPPVGQMAHDLLIPGLPPGSKLSEVMLLIIAIVGTTVAPWQLFFQQSYVIDKRITPRFIKYERIDLWLGIVIVIVGAAAMMAFCAQTFGGRPEFGNFVDAGAVAHGIEKYYGRLPGVLFALALIDASIIGASAVSLSSAYALGDILSLKHSLHRKAGDAKGFYAVYCGLIAIAAALVLTPGVSLGLLTNMVQTLAGVLLPGATVFLLLLCNDKQVLGPWVNSRLINYGAGAIVAALVMMSIILTASVLFPSISGTQIVWILVSGSLLTAASAIGVKWFEKRRGVVDVQQSAIDKSLRDSWRMPPIEQLQPAQISLLNRLWMAALRGYLIIAALMLMFKMVQLVFGAE